MSHEMDAPLYLDQFFSALQNCCFVVLLLQWMIASINYKEFAKFLPEGLAGWILTGCSVRERASLSLPSPTKQEPVKRGSPAYSSGKRLGSQHLNVAPGMFEGIYAIF